MSYGTRIVFRGADHRYLEIMQANTGLLRVPFEGDEKALKEIVMNRLKNAFGWLKTVRRSKNEGKKQVHKSGIVVSIVLMLAIVGYLAYRGLKYLVGLGVLFWNAKFWTEGTFASFGGYSDGFGLFVKWVGAISLLLIAVIYVISPIWSLISSVFTQRTDTTTTTQSLWLRLKNKKWLDWFYKLPTYHRAVVRTFEDIRYIAKPWPDGTLRQRVFGGIKFKFPWQDVEIYSQELQTLEGLETEMQFTSGDLEATKTPGMDYGKETTRMLGPQAKLRLMLRFYYYNIRQWLRQEPDVRDRTKVRDRYFRQIVEGTTQRCQSKMRIPDLKNVGGWAILHCAEARITALKDQVRADLKAAEQFNAGKAAAEHVPLPNLSISDNEDPHLRDVDADTYWRWLEKYGRKVGLVPHVSDFKFTRSGQVVYKPRPDLVDETRDSVSHLSKVDPNSEDHTLILNKYFEFVSTTNEHALQLRMWRDGILVAELQSKDVEPETDIAKAITELGKATIKRNEELVRLRSKLDSEKMMLELRKISAEGDVAKASIWLKGAGVQPTGENVMAVLKFHQVFRTMEEMAKAEGRGSNFIVSLTDVLRAAGASGLEDLAKSLK